MEDVKVQKYGPPSGKHGSCVFYKAFKKTKDGKSEIITLGHFFFLKIIEGVPICIGELQLVWEDKTASQDLASIRLYFLPECTPEGRQTFHGEDEVLAYSEKIVLKLDDLAGLIVHNVTWSEGRRAFVMDKLQRHDSQEDFEKAFRLNSFGLDTRDVDAGFNKTDETTEPDTSPSITIMSYARYCRYRSILLRLKNVEDKWLRHAIVSAIGGFSANKENNRVYFCRDTFEHSDLDDLEMRCDHLAPNLKGRPRKRKGSKVANDSSEESNCSSSFNSQNESTVNKIRTGARDTPLRNGFRIDKAKVSKDEQAFLIELHKFMKSRFTPIGRIPSLGFKQIDLFQFYSLAQELGGYEQISNKRMWKHLYDKLGGNPGFTSAATCTRRHYEKLLLPYERYKKGKDIKAMLVHKKKKFKIESSEDPKPDDEDQKENVVKEEPKVKEEAGNEEGPVNGKVVHRESIDLSDRAQIIKKEIEEMKMRKVRKPSGAQKTVRELLHRNGRDMTELMSDKAMEKTYSDKYGDLKVSNEYRYQLEQELPDQVSHDTTLMQNLSSPITSPESRSHGHTLLSPLNQPQPLFYPQLIPVGSTLRGVAPVAMPFMIPQFHGIQAVTNPLQSVQSLGNPIPAEIKHLQPGNKSSSASAISVNSSKQSSNMTPPCAPPSKHIQPPKGPITSHLANSSSQPRKITPAHTNNAKRQYPYLETGRNLPSFSHSDSKHTPGASDLENKRQRLSESPGDGKKVSDSGQYDIPVLDLSMKTLRAQEARQQRGESLLFNTSFNKDSKGVPKIEPCDVPQDLSLKSSKSSPMDMSHKFFASSSAPFSVPLNVPLPRSHLDHKPHTVLSSAKVESARRAEIKNEKPDSQSVMSSTAKVATYKPGEMASIGGLPIDLGAFVHPAFPQQMLMQGIFPTPLQLQQMIQGQVSASLPLVRPEFLPATPVMFPPAFSSVPSTLFSSASPVLSKNSNSNGTISKR